MAKPVFQPFTTEVLFSPMPLNSVLSPSPFVCLSLKLYLTLWRTEPLLTAEKQSGALQKFVVTQFSQLPHLLGNTLIYIQLHNSGS